MQRVESGVFCLAVAIAVACVSGDQSCLKTPPTPVQPDPEWAGKVGNWYLSAASRLHAYRTAAEVANVPETALTPYDIHYRACLRFEWGAETIVSGFGGKKSDVALTPNSDGTNSFRYSNLGIDGRATVVLTDNATFVMFYVCYPKQNEAVWAVISSVPSLPEKTRKQIYKQAKKLGFDEADFRSLRFESCEVANGEPLNDGKDEL